MIEWLLSLPKTMFVGLVLAIGVLGIVIFNPPHTVCDSQLEQFKEAQKNFLYLDPKQKFNKTTEFFRLQEKCKITNSPGGCYELFSKLRKLQEDLDNVADECNDKVSNEKAVREAFWQSLDLMIRIAWGAKAPRSPQEKQNWFDTADLNLFCRLKAQAVSLYGEEQMNKFFEKYFTELPGAQQIARESAWELSLMSTNCRYYP